MKRVLEESFLASTADHELRNRLPVNGMSSPYNFDTLQYRRRRWFIFCHEDN